MKKMRTTHTPSGHYRCGDETDEEVEARVARSRKMMVALSQPLEPWEYALNSVLQGIIIAGFAGLGAYVGYRLCEKKEETQTFANNANHSGVRSMYNILNSRKDF